MQPAPPFPDVERAVMARLNSLAATIGTYTPSDLKGSMPFVLVYRFAGIDDWITDTATIGIDVFTSTRSAGVPLAESVRQLMISAPYAVTVGSDTVVIDNVMTAEAPREVPYGDSAIRRWVSSYAVSLRR